MATGIALLHEKIQFKSRYIGHVAARAHLGPRWRPKDITMKVKGKEKLTGRFADNEAYEINGNVETQIGSVMRLEVM